MTIIKKKKKKKGKSQVLPRMHCWWECKMMQPLWKTVWWLPYDLAIFLLGMCPTEWKVNVHRNIIQ
jgi:hypothetical protein